MIRFVFYIFFLFICCICKGQGLYSLNATVNVVTDTFNFGKNDCKGLYQSKLFNFQAYSRQAEKNFMQTEYHFNVDSKNDTINKEKVKIRENINFLFSWQDSSILSIVYDTLKHAPQGSFKFIPIDNNLLNYSDKENRIYQYQGATNFNDLFNISKLQKNIPDSALFKLELAQKKAGVYWLINSHSNEELKKTIFLVVDKKGNAQFIRPVQFWMYLPLLNVVDLYEKYDLQPVSAIYDDYHTIDVIKKLRYLKKIQQNPAIKFAADNQYRLIALGYGDTEIIESLKWSKLLDFNVFGNYKCMTENYSIPTTKFFSYSYQNPKIAIDSMPYLIPLDSIFKVQYDDRGKNQGYAYKKIEVGHKTQTGIIGELIIELKKKYDCTGIYGINQYNYEYGKLEQLGTVNNIEYMPGVYFLPDYFKIKSINGLPLEEFAKKQCEK